MRLTPFSDSVSLRLRTSKFLTSPHTITRRLIFQEAHRHRIAPAPIACKHAVSGLFHSPSGVLFTFPSRYYTLSVAKEYFALEGGPPCFPQGFTCLVVLWNSTILLCFSSTGLSPSVACFPNTIRLKRTFVTSRVICNSLTIDPTTPYAQRLQA